MTKKEALEVLSKKPVISKKYEGVAQDLYPERNHKYVVYGQGGGFQSVESFLRNIHKCAFSTKKSISEIVIGIIDITEVGAIPGTHHDLVNDLYLEMMYRHSGF